VQRTLRRWADLLRAGCSARLEGFSDGVLAVIITSTMMVLELRSSTCPCSSVRSIAAAS